MANLSNEQFQQLLATMTKSAMDAAMSLKKNENTDTTPNRNDPAALGPMRQCLLGDDKMRKLTIFEDWLEEAESRMEYIGTSSDKEKLILLRTWGGQDIKELIKRQESIVEKTKVKTTPNDRNDQGMPVLEGDTKSGDTCLDNYKDTIEAIRNTLMRNVNRTMAMHQLMTTKQGSIPGKVS